MCLSGALCAFRMCSASRLLVGLDGYILAIYCIFVSLAFCLC